MTQSIHLTRVNRLLLCAVLTVAVLYYGQKVLIPLTFSVFFAMLFTPFSNRLEGWGVHRIVTALLSILTIIFVTVGIFSLVYMQGKKMSDQWPEIEKKSTEFVEKAQAYVSQKLSVPQKKQEELINKQVKSGTSSVGKVVKDFIAGLAGVAAASVLVLVMTFLFLYQREKYEQFFVRINSRMPKQETEKLVKEISTVAQSYLTGRVMSIAIFTILFTTGFLIVGLENAFLLAFIAALLTIVPYVGSIIGGLFPFAVALITGDSTTTAVGALAVIAIVQAVDNYFIEPYVIGGEVNISALFTILILFIGGLIWGVAGMVLFLPMLGVTRIIFEHIPHLRPYAFLIGDQKENKHSHRFFKKFGAIFRKKK